MQEQHPHGGEWLRDIVFGLNDGLVTTLVFILAVSRIAHPGVVVIAFGELLAGAISMGLGAYLSARTAQAVLMQQIATEGYEIVHEPEEERAELRNIYYEKGFRGSLLELVVRYLTADRRRWLTAMVRDELGVVPTEPPRPAWLQGVLVAGSFMAGAFVPILPFLLRLPAPQLWAYGLTVLTALALGAVKARYTTRGALFNGLEFLAITTAGAAAGLGIGLLLQRLAGAG
jgi:VIT1/CCC1 family predicted Fe2+/Mn2+ transporter